MRLNDKPRIRVSKNATLGSKTASSFTFHGMKVKPLDIPLGYTTLNLEGIRREPSLERLSWKVDFPQGFHVPLVVDIAEFTKGRWNELQALEIWADFHNEGVVMDWEFCLDDLELSFDR